MFYDTTCMTFAMHGKEPPRMAILRSNNLPSVDIVAFRKIEIEFSCCYKDGHCLPESHVTLVLSFHFQYQVSCSIYLICYNQILIFSFLTSAMDPDELKKKIAELEEQFVLSQLKTNREEVADLEEYIKELQTTIKSERWTTRQTIADKNAEIEKLKEGWSKHVAYMLNQHC